MAANDFRAEAIKALSDPELRENYRTATDRARAARATLFADKQEWRSLRALGAAIRARSLLRLPELLEQLEARLIANGVQVHWAETVDEGNAIVAAILERRRATKVMKGKSMVSEEMGLNHALEARGIEVIEADLGEYVIQLEHERPAHIIMPALHKNRRQIARLFAEKIKGAVYTDDIEQLTALARRTLRQKFEEADAGISGVNVAVAETGTLVLVENEGNGRMVTTVPPVHIAVMGIEKVVERLEDVPPILSLLVRSAISAPITTYVNMITGPRRAGEKDGPEELHVVLLDNGRSRIYDDPELRDTLRCIRCGACMNHCPVYSRAGGHAYPGTYPGPIGKVLSPQLLGMEAAGDLPHASALCEACTEICPVAIPLGDLLVRLRREGLAPESKAVEGAGSRVDAREASIWGAWARACASPWRYRLMLWGATRFGRFLPRSLPGLKEWTSARARPPFARRSLHELVEDEGVRDE